MSKKILALVLVVVMVCALFCGCSSTVTKTTTTTTVNADGTSTSTTTTTVNENGNVSEKTETTSVEYYEDIPVTIENISDFTFYGMYIKNSSDDSWGENLLEGVEGGFLDVNEAITVLMSFYSDEPYQDFSFVDEDGASLDFEEMYLGDCVNGGTVTISVNDDGSYHIHVEAD